MAKIDKGFQLRIIFGVVSLLLLVFVVGLLTKKQLGALSVPGALPGASAAGTAQVPTPQLQSQQLQNQVKKSLEDAMQQARPQEDVK